MPSPRPKTSPTPPLRRVVTIQQIAGTFGVCYDTVVSWMADPDFPRPLKIGRRLFFYADEIETYAAAQRQEGRARA